MEIEKNIIAKLNTLKAESSTIEKTNLLREYLMDENFLTVVELALDDTLQYNVKKLVAVKPKEKVFFEDLCDHLIYLSSKQGANKKEKEILSSFAINDDWRRIILCIIIKNLGCGVAAKLVNEAIPNTLTVIPYMRCSGIDKVKNIFFPAYNQKKEDGLFSNNFVNILNEHVRFETRNGNVLIFPENHLKDGLLKHTLTLSDTYVFMGELRIQINGKWLPRKKSNGLINKALKKNQSISISESERIHFICWDVVTEKEFYLGKSDTPYDERLENVKTLLNVGDKIHVSETKEVSNFKEASEWAIKEIADGEEGCVLKNKKTIWKDGTSTEQIKLKAGSISIDEETDRECELKVTRIQYGKVGKKYEKCLGGLICESIDKKLFVTIGIGFTDKERGYLGKDKDGYPIILENIDEWLEETYLDEIITVRFNEVIDSEGRKEKSMFLARYVEIRHDKNKADTLEYIENLGA